MKKRLAWVFVPIISIALLGCGEKGGTDSVSTNITKKEVIESSALDDANIAGKQNNGIIAEVVPES